MSNDQYSNQPPVDPNYQPYNQTPPPNQQQPYSQTPPNQPQPYQPYSNQAPQSYQPQSQGQFVVPSANQLTSSFKSSSLGRRLAIGGGLLAWICYFLPWYHVSTEIFGVSDSTSFNGLRGLLPWMGFMVLTSVLVNLLGPFFGQQVYPRFQRSLNNFSLGKAAFFGLAAALGLALIGGFIVSPSDQGIAGIDAGFSFGFYLSILALGTATAGGWLMQQSGE
ncbi:MAG TPA: hypothetical protein DEF47_24125 [Herpetosiphon sp.]|uniref:Uncharacterized protein n=1 Tax=Herpetosiphon aurantiacus (strain ATCC 23779 / DSM 785 / 114-95) TaxID=316274 RepID=A9B1E7_HERA2|nr:hypothetical protein [Herpetosiphon sp.]ABX07334.1 hypothetical protein Haur_4703 [Herpetosiphon aurantiacus DSM 785]HBW52982.1 hypothetical protein [Herpetosiphon sp.]